MKLKDEIKNIDTSVKKLREFGLLVGGVFLSLGGLMAWRGKPSAPIFFALGGFLFLFGVARPQVLRYIYIFWMAFAAVMGWVMSRVLLTVLFYTTVTPIGLLMRLQGKDLLDVKYPDSRPSFWLKRKNSARREDCENQY
ncbi:MAG: hypothetical protein KBC91_02170 [Candidatus Omnitrophica bacterium]|nr:hypothetical protein [Candidatus Omnitrophota bacterium]